MHAKVDWDQYIVHSQDIYSPCPPSDRCVSAGHQFGVEERVEGVNSGVAILLTTLHQHVHVKVNHLE